MDFNDYGIVDWFDSSKGFGLIKTVHNGQVFAHEKNGINGTLVKGGFAFIECIRKDQYGKNTGVSITACNTGEKLKIIIDRNYEGLSKDTMFLDFLKKYHKGDYLQVINEYVLELWQKSELHQFDSNLDWLINKLGVVSFNRLLNFKYKWIHDSKFTRRFNDKYYRSMSKIDVISDFLVNNIIYKEYNQDIKWLLNYGTEEALIKFFEVNYNSFMKDEWFIQGFKEVENPNLYKAAGNFIQDVWKSNSNLDFDENIKWIIKKASSKELKQLIDCNIHIWLKSRPFIQSLKEFETWKGGEDIIGDFFLECWKCNSTLQYNDEIKWILFYGNEKTFVKIIDTYNYHKIYDIEFIENIMNFKYKETTYYGMRVRVDENNRFITDYSEKVKIISNYLFEFWNSQKEKDYDNIIKRLINDRNVPLLEKAMKICENKWLTNENFIEHLRNTNLYNEFQEKFLFKVWVSHKTFKYDENLIWLLDNDSLNTIKQIAKLGLNYNEFIIEKIYSALFPNNDQNYFLKLPQKTTWSDDFRLSYIEHKENERKIELSKLFLKEFQIDKSNLTLKNNIRKETHSATDLASFVFCPASYAICQTYNIDNKEQENIFIGIKEHENQRLLSLSDRQLLLESSIGDKCKNFNHDFERILNAECISQGHKDTEPTIYYSTNKKISGIPDYIFKDKQGYFAVEEKYTFKKYEELTSLYENHKTQALAYLYGLSDFQFNEVFILYWFITKLNYNDTYDVYNYRIFKLTRTENNKNFIVNTFYKLESIQQRVPYSFPPQQINYKKCVNCSYFPYCENKKGSNAFVELLPLNTNVSGDN